MNKPDGVCLGCFHGVVCHDQPAGPVRADGAHQPAGSARSGDHSRIEFGKRIAGGAAGKTEVTRQRHFEASTDTRPLMRDDDGLFDRFEKIIEVVPGISAIAAAKSSRSFAGTAGRKIGDLEASRKIAAF